MKFLAPAGRGLVDESVRAGEAVFGAVGCASCHVPSLQTGPSANPLFNRKVVPLFSDLLLHDIGTADGIQQQAATAQEFRTPALWGLRLRRPLLHDGSAATIEDAINVARRRRPRRRASGALPARSARGPADVSEVALSSDFRLQTSSPLRPEASTPRARDRDAAPVLPRSMTESAAASRL